MPSAIDDLFAFLDSSPSPWHVVQHCERLLASAGFQRLDERERWSLHPGDRRYVVRADASLIAFIVGCADPVSAGCRLIGAHTDSPGLRLKPRPAEDHGGMVRLGVEVYGGPILATFADRDLGLAGRVAVRDGDGHALRLLHLDQPLLRLPNLAIHMNREVNENGLKLHKQNELPLLFAVGDPARPAESRFRSLLADALQVAPADLLTWDLAVCDTQKAVRWGENGEFIAASRLDNLASCHAALSALLAQDTPAATAVCAFFDHEEVGSESASGAAGSFLVDTLDRLGSALGLDSEDQRRTLAASFFVSADMAHAWQPNFPAAYEPGHRVLVNGGPVIKSNANQRYATSADSAARFMSLCRRAGVPCQQYAHRTDLGCGSTIGPIVAARLGIPCVDVGSPLWAMHSIRESAGALDHAHMVAVLNTLFRN